MTGKKSERKEENEAKPDKQGSRSWTLIEVEIMGKDR